METEQLISPPYNAPYRGGYSFSGGGYTFNTFRGQRSGNNPEVAKKMYFQVLGRSEGLEGTVNFF